MRGGSGFLSGSSSGDGLDGFGDGDGFGDVFVCGFGCC